VVLVRKIASAVVNSSRGYWPVFILKGLWFRRRVRMVPGRGEVLSLGVWSWLFFIQKMLLELASQMWFWSVRRRAS